MNDFNFVEEVLRKVKSSYDISKDKQLQQEKTPRYRLLLKSSMMQLKYMLQF